MMNGLKYNSIVYFISLVILATLCIQVYWNSKNYQSGKQQLINDVQTSLDNAVDQYYTGLVTEGPFGIMKDSIRIRTNSGHFRDSINIDTVWLEDSKIYSNDSIDDIITIMQTRRSDSLDISLSFTDSNFVSNSKSPIFELISGSKNPIRELSSKIFVSVSEENLSLQKIDSLFLEELDRKNIAVDYGLSHKGMLMKEETLRPEIIEKSSLETISKSPYFFHNNELKAHFTNVTLAVLKRNLLGILLSFLLVASVVFCLIYLLKIIQRQKQLAEVKNDLISNITHEFKTPIATIGIAMEAIQNFNAENDSEKNLRYAKISKEQVEKLNMMVEKLLETATLDSEKLKLNLESHDLHNLLERASSNEALSLGEKRITFSSSEEYVAYPIDVFHFENAINNIIDNAVKYGGNEISVQLQEQKNILEIIISDNGTSLTEIHKKQIFEKFYRVPKGNTHDVKGFGIGLYYSKKIIEKHGGSISVSVQPTTQFKITLPYG